jgi:nitronate monooxygenase
LPGVSAGAEAAGADAVVVSGAEAGGHRGAFRAEEATARTGTTFALVPQVADAVGVPVVAAGGIADGRGLAAALALGASAAQVGTALLRTPEAGTAKPWADALAVTRPEDTVLTRAFSGRLARAVRSAWTEAVGDDALPYPSQRHAMGPLRDKATREGDAGHMQMWAGQGAALARDEPAGAVVTTMWDEARAMLA